MDNTSSVHGSASKRKYDSVALEIVEDIKRRCTKELNPETEAIKDRLVKQATDAIAIADIDHDDLQDRWKLLTKLIDSRDSDSRSFEEANRLNYFMEIGDWFGGIHKAVKAYEPEVQREVRAKLYAKLKSDGMGGKDREVASKLHDRFIVATGLSPNTTLSLVQPEMLLVEEWRKAGKPEGKGPETPYLDRIGAMCDKANVTRNVYLDALRISSDRNDAAHHPPPRPWDHLTADEKVDWKSVQAACRERELKVEEDFKNGKLLGHQRDSFIKFIDVWLNSHVSGLSEDGNPEATLAGTELAKQGKREQDKIGATKSTLEKPIVPPPSPYEEGKWDDLETSTSR